MDSDKKEGGLLKASLRSKSFGDLVSLLSGAGGTQLLKRNTSSDKLSLHFTENINFTDQQENDKNRSSVPPSPELKPKMQEKAKGLSRPASTGNLQGLQKPEHGFSFMTWLTTKQTCTITETISEASNEDTSDGPNTQGRTMGTASSANMAKPVATGGQICAAASQMAKCNQNKSRSSTYRDLNVVAPSYW